MAETTYIPYGLDEISQQDLMTSLADGLPEYMDSKKWLLKPKNRDKWLKAYLDIISHGIAGASNSSGLWEIEYNNLKIDVDSMSDIDKEIYQDAAHYIRYKMSQLTPKVKEEEKKKDLEKFNFQGDFLKQLLRDYGNNESLFLDPNEGWNSLDKRDEKTGLRNSAKRKERVRTILLNYLDNFDDSKYDFTDTPFSDANDARSKILAAINALGTTDDVNDDIAAFNALGISHRALFNNGGSDNSGHTDDSGNFLTWEQWAKHQNDQNALKQKKQREEENAKLAQQRANQYQRFRFHTGVGATAEQLSKYSDVIGQLNSYNTGNQLTKQLKSELIGAFQIAARNNQLLNLSKEELARFGPGYANNPTRLKKLPNLEGFYWDSIGNRVILPFREMSNPQGLLDIINQSSPEAKAKVNMNTPLSQMNEWSPEMKKEMEAIAWDVASILDPEAFSGSAMALHASRLRDEANPNRSTLEKWLDRGTAALGGILGVGDLLVTGKLGYRLYQLGRSIGSVTKFAGMLGAGFGAIGAYLAKDSIMKLSNPESLTPLDLENIAYGFMGLIGLKSFAKARNKQTIGKQTNPTVTEHNITINDKNGTHVIKVDEATAKEINDSYKFGRNNKTKSDEKTFNHEKVKKAVEEYNNNPENTKKIDLESASIQSSSKFGVTTGKPVKTEYVRNPNAPEYAPVGTRWYSPFGYIAKGNNKWGYYLGGGWQRKAWENAVPEQSSKGLWLRAKEFWNPEPRPIQSESVKTPEVKSTETPKTTGKRTWSEIEKGEKQWTMDESMKEWKDILKGELKPLAIGENFKAGDFHFNVMGHSGSEKGIVEINFGSKKESIKFESLKDLRKKVLKFMKENAPKITIDGKSKYDAKKMGEILKQLKAKGVFKQGGKIDKQKIQQYKKFIKK